ncbi:MAG: hypothetical protein ACI9SC_001019 [Gammaproteobacteria bacterium]|jgi:hypothetical protein
MYRPAEKFLLPMNKGISSYSSQKTPEHLSIFLKTSQVIFYQETASHKIDCDKQLV